MLRMKDSSCDFLAMLGKVWVSLGKFGYRKKNLRERNNLR